MLSSLEAEITLEAKGTVFGGQTLPFPFLGITSGLGWLLWFLSQMSPTCALGLPTAETWAWPGRV